MSKRIVLATWSFGGVATEAGWGILEKDGSALDAVVAGATAVEEDECVDSVGYGGLPDKSGEVSLDASVMVSPAECGSVCYVRKYVRVTELARKVMEETDHVLLAGDGAERFAGKLGMEERVLLTEKARKRWEKWEREHGGDDGGRWVLPANVEELAGIEEDPGSESAVHNKYHDTVGVLAMDGEGRLAGACSTSGLAFKMSGRVGDSPIVGHGLYVHPEYGAVVATGNGELVMGTCGAFFGVECMRGGAGPLEAVKTALGRVVESYELKEHHQVGMIALGVDGSWASGSLRGGFSVARWDEGGNEQCEPKVILMGSKEYGNEEASGG